MRASNAGPQGNRLSIESGYVNADLDDGELHGPEVERLHVEACEAMPDCTKCNATDGNRCRNPISNRLRKLPCLPRVTAARSQGWIPVFKAKCPECETDVTVANVPDNVQLSDGPEKMIKFYCRNCQQQWLEQR